MANAKRDENSVPTLLGVSNADGTTPVTIYADPTTHRLLVDLAGGGTGDVNGPGSSTLDALARWDDLTGTLLADSTVKLTDAGVLSPVTSDTAVLGSGTLMWSDLFLASGAVINFNNGNFTITHSAGLLTFSGNITASAGTVTLGTVAGAIDAGGATSLEIPNGAAPTVNADGEIAVDTTVADFSAGIIKYFSTEEMGVVAMPIAQFSSPTDGYAVVYNAADDEFVLADVSGGGGANTALSNLASVAINEALLPGADNSIALGDGTHTWADLFIGSGGVINFNNGNATITHSAGLLTSNVPITAPALSSGKAASGFRRYDLLIDGTYTQGIGAEATNATDPVLGSYVTADSFLRFNFQASGLMEWGDGAGAVDTNLYRSAASTLKTDDAFVATGGVFPAANDGAAIGSATVSWSDLFLASGAVINFSNGNVVLTHSSGILTMGTGELRITTPGTDSASVPTLGSTSTLTNKTLTAPTLGGATQLAESATIRLDASLSADGTYSGIAIAGTAGATLAFGDVIYLAAADSRWELADASAASTSGSVLVGMCVLAAAADGDPTVVLLQGNVRADTAFPALTVSAPVYISETAGDVTNTAPTTTDSVTRVLGFGLTADSMYFNPSGDYATYV